MAGLELCDPSLEPVYQELLEEFPEALPDAIAASLQFMRIVANQNIRQETLLSQYGLTMGRFSLLMILRHEPDHRLSPSEMARRAHVSKATMTQFIDALEKDELVERASDPNDRRAMLIRLTRKAEGLLKKLLPEHLAQLGEVTSTLSKAELKELFRILDKLVRE